MDCKLTQFNNGTMLISLTLVFEAGDEFYVELTNTYQVEDCIDFLSENVLPQLDLPAHAVSFTDVSWRQRTFWMASMAC